MKHKDFKKIKTKKTKDGVSVHVQEYTEDTAHKCSAREGREVIFSTVWYNDYTCPFCNEQIIEVE